MSLDLNAVALERCDRQVGAVKKAVCAVWMEIFPYLKAQVVNSYLNVPY